MLKTLYEKGYLNYSKIIMENSKALGLKPEEALVLIKILDSGSLSVDYFTGELLATANKIDKILADLLQRGFYELFLAYDNGVGKECLSFDSFFNKLRAILQKSQTLDHYDIEKTSRYIASKFNRVLTANELENLRHLMVDENYTYEEIIVATNTLVLEKRPLTMKAIMVFLTNNQIGKSNSDTKVSKGLKEFYNRI